MKRYDAIIIGTGQAGPPLAGRLTEWLSYPLPAPEDRTPLSPYPHPPDCRKSSTYSEPWSIAYRRRGPYSP
jgi:hypothetical protein